MARNVAPDRRRGSFPAIASGALAAVCAIVVTGSLVRLTGSGLGCADWPRCSETRFIDVSSGHSAIEQLNRLFTGAVSLAVVAAVLVAHRQLPHRPSLVRWAWALVAGVVAQVVLGGVVVLTGLHPISNMAHFLLSMALVMAGLVLVRRSGQDEDQRWWRGAEDLPATVSSRQLVLLVVAAATTLVAGTAVTATGPHAGDENAPRFGFELASVARIHSGAMYVTIAVLAWLWWRTHSAAPSAERDRLRGALATMAGAIVVQGGIGYWQYLTGVPAALVAFHVAGATAFWLSAVNVLAAPPRRNEVARR